MLPYFHSSWAQDWAQGLPSLWSFSWISPDGTCFTPLCAHYFLNWLLSQHLYVIFSVCHSPIFKLQGPSGKRQRLERGSHKLRIIWQHKELKKARKILSCRIQSETFATSHPAYWLVAYTQWQKRFCSFKFFDFWWRVTATLENV